MCFILEPSANERQSSVLLSNLDLEAHFIAMNTVITFVILCASMRCNFCLTEVIVLLDQAGIVQTIRTLVVLQGLYGKSLIFLLAVWAGSSFCIDMFRCHQMSCDVFRLSSHWQPATWSAKQLFDKVSQSAMHVNTIIVHAVDSTWHSWLSSLHMNIHRPSHKVCFTRNKPQTYQTYLSSCASFLAAMPRPYLKLHQRRPRQIRPPILALPLQLWAQEILQKLWLETRNDFADVKFRNRYQNFRSMSETGRFARLPAKLEAASERWAVFICAFVFFVQAKRPSMNPWQAMF